MPAGVAWPDPAFPDGGAVGLHVHEPAPAVTLFLSLSPGVDEGEKNSLAGGAFGQSKLLPFPFSEFPNLHADSVFGSSGTDIRSKKCIRLSTFSPAAESYSLIHLLFVSFIF